MKDNIFQFQKGASLRDSNLHRMHGGHFDVLIVGGGINGAASAAALSAHGVRVALIDQGDFAGVTSQESSNLAWGGIKYLETGEFGLVRDLCRARNRLLASYPSSVREIRFLTTLEPEFRRSRLTLLCGAWLYWLMGSGFTRRPRLLAPRDIEQDAPWVNASRGPGGIEYSDAFLVDNDARFVFGFIRSALERGAAVTNYTQALRSRRDPSGPWITQVRDEMSKNTFTITSQVLINACGPHVDEVNATNGIETRYRHIFSKGIHLVVNRVGDSSRVLTFFADDGRPFFIIPMGDKSCIGTTDTRVEDLPATVTAEDRRFILDNINKRLKLRQELTEADVIAERCGVRPLVVRRDHDSDEDSEWTSLSRRHAIEVDQASNHISVFGGKLTDCLNIGDEMVLAAKNLGAAPNGSACMWFGEPVIEAKDNYFEQARALRLDMAPADVESLAARLWRRYGAGSISILDAIDNDARMAERVFSDFVRAELHYVARREMVVKLEDFLRRRSSLALTKTTEQLASTPGLLEACRILFGNEADAKFHQYFIDRQVASNTAGQERSG